MNEKTERNKTIDIAKALGIIFVVLGHTGFPKSSILFRFHMALFFILSGYCFSDTHIKNINSMLFFILRKIKGLYIPFVLFNVVCVLLQNFLIHINIYTDDPAFLSQAVYGNQYGLTAQLGFSDTIVRVKNILIFSGEQQLGGGLWFLRVLFFSVIMWGG